MPEPHLNERARTQQLLMRAAFDTTYYQVLDFRKSREDYDPYAASYELHKDDEGDDEIDWDWDKE